MVVAKTGVWFVCMPSFCVKNGSVQSGTPEWKFSRQAHVFIFPLGLSINNVGNWKGEGSKSFKIICMPNFCVKNGSVQSGTPK